MSGKTKSKTKIWDWVLFLVLLFVVVWELMGLMGYTITTISCDSWSMYPNLYCGCFYMIKEISYPGQVEKGDVVVFRRFSNGHVGTVIHRVIEWDERYLVTQGDNNGVEDTTLGWSQVTHKYVNGYCFLSPEGFEDEVAAWKGAQH